MADQDRPRRPRTQPADELAAGEREELLFALETRFTPHLDAASLAVRDAERDLTQAQERLARAELAAADDRYRSDPLTFMRASVDEEVEALGRKSTPKKIRTFYRFLLDRAVELAAAELQGFHDDQAADQQERDGGVDACVEAVRRAAQAAEDTRLMQERVRRAEQAARRGLEVMVEKLS